MKIIKSLFLSALFYALPTHTVFEFTHGTQLAIKTALREVIQVGNEYHYECTRNPAFHAFQEMQTTITNSGLSTIINDENISRTMHSMQKDYQADDSYKTALAAAQQVTKEKKDDFSAWEQVQKTVKQSIKNYVQKHSSFQYPVIQHVNPNDRHTSLLDLNAGADLRNAHVFKASVLMLFYQQQECERIQLTAMQKHEKPHNLFVGLFGLVVQKYE